ncbi:hypothetical protein FRC96_12370 [Lujinxingia vulgaris]|uniref:Uncharacterized protein n=2 Tax=Lujinxingia vulgaris TaxID=2600176 RepID=A0A5C6X169_9DELT|nr:hypothetical protein FRC96_12370 [Lujinxingia vulgaris]
MMSTMKWLCGALALTAAGLMAPGCGPSQTIDLRNDAGFERDADEEERDTGNDPDTGFDADVDDDPDATEDPDADVDPDGGNDPDADEDPDADVDDEPDADDPGPLTDGEAAARAMIAGFCDAVWSCPDGSQQVAFLSLTLGRYPDAQACTDAWRAGAGSMDLSELIRSVDEGRIVVDRDLLDACTDAIAEAACNAEGDQTGMQIPEACRTAMAGQASAGDACINLQDCASGLRCDYSYEQDAPCYGTCVDPAVADACGNDGICDEATSYCDRSGTEPECVDYEVGDECTEGGGECAEDFVCVRGYCQFDYAPEPINLAGEGETCSQFDQTFCLPGLTCQTSAANGSVSTCERPRAAGEVCIQTSDCEAGLRCGEQDGGPSICGALLPLGEPCQESGECESSYCFYDYEVTGEHGTCAERQICELP